MLALRISVCVCLAFAICEIRGQDFDLSDAFDDPKTTTTKRPIPTKKPNAGDDFHLEDAFGGDDPKNPVAPKPNPGGGHFGDDDLGIAAGGQPNNPSSGGNFGDDDLHHAAGGKPHQPGGSDGQGGNTDDGQKNTIAGIVGSIGVMLVGAVGSFIAYRKKKFCFKEGADDEPVDTKREILQDRRRQAKRSSFKNWKKDPTEENRIRHKRWQVKFTDDSY
ncbi:CD99 antigen-like isoform X2 [Rhinatrema bivittatum]|uniref:CD99 antigen-like isoform X2 n=1 Tax=Rhinatrema bivittatum TaxID=194408 RepID=UPI00112E287E|nr:CD99 antigen-like isoform X2 [Rhinatrema bivittatum]